MWTNALLTLLLAPALIFNTAWAQNCDNSYEQSMSGQAELSHDLTFSEPAVPAECINSSMRSMEQLVRAKSNRFKPFAYCNKEGKYESTTQPLCRTENLLLNIQSVTHLVADCLELPPKALFPIINVESGFFPNALAPGGDDAGIGQVTPIAATDVNQHWNWLESHVNASSKSSCLTIKPHLNALKVMDLNTNYICQFTEPELNPLRNSLYSGFFFLINSKYFYDFFNERQISRRLSHLMGRPITLQERDQLMHFLNISSYNRGFEDMKGHFISYLGRAESRQNIDWESTQSLSQEILNLEQQIQNTKGQTDITALLELRRKLEEAKWNYNNLIRQRSGTHTSFAVFDLENTSANSFRSYLKEKRAHQYLELILSNNTLIENRLGGAGTCSEFKKVPMSSALHQMIW